MFMSKLPLYFKRTNKLNFIFYGISFLLICLNCTAMDYLKDKKNEQSKLIGGSSTPFDSDSESDGLAFLKDDISSNTKSPSPQIRKFKRDTSSKYASLQDLTKLYTPKQENPLTWSPVSFSKDLLEEDPTKNLEALSALMLDEIDRDFFAQYDDFTIYEKSWQKKAIPYIRGLLAAGLGIFVSMSITSQFMIHVGEWFHAYRDTSGRTALVTFIATMSSLMFTNQWDNRLKRMCNYLWPARYMCHRNVDKDLEKAAILESEKFKRTSAKMDYYVFAKGLLLVSSGAYAIVPLWWFATSKEAKDFPVTTCIAGTFYFFSLADIFYQSASLKPNPLTDEAARKRDLLIAHVRLFKEKISTDPETAENAYNLIKKNLNSKNIIDDDIKDGGLSSQTDRRDFLFSALFLTPEDTNILEDFQKRYSAYHQLVESHYNPSLLDKRASIANVTNMGLGIGFLYLSVLLMEEYEVTLSGIRVPKDASYWTALAGAILQSGSFVYSTYGIHHSYTQKLADVGTTLKKCFSYDWLTEKYQEVKSAYTWTSAFGWLGGKIKETTSLVTGVLLSSPQLKKALDTYSNLTPGMRFLQSLPPFMLENSFLTHVFSKNLGEIKSKFLTSDFFYSITKRFSSCCRTSGEEAHIKETLNLLCDGAIKQLEYFGDKAEFLLYYRILEHSGEWKKKKGDINTIIIDNTR